LDELWRSISKFFFVKEREISGRNNKKKRRGEREGEITIKKSVRGKWEGGGERRAEANSGEGGSEREKKVLLAECRLFEIS
jgi:hypothetical protein